MRPQGRERLIAVGVALAAASLLAAGVFADQIGETLFNATLV